MATPSMNGGAVVGVRLTEVPIVVRRRYGRLLYERAVEDKNLDLALRINGAVEHPSDTVYWLPATAVSEVRARQRW